MRRRKRRGRRVLAVIVVLAAVVAAWGPVRTEAVIGDGTQGRVAAGAIHTLMVASDGTVWVWGGNGSGQLGLGDTTGRNRPVQVPELSGVVAVAAGWAHSLAVRGDGTVWAWGYNGDGQLGLGDGTNRITPVRIQSLTDTEPPSVSWLGFDLAPPHFSPNGDGSRDSIWVTYAVSEPVTTTLLVVRDGTAEPVRTLVAGQQQEGVLQFLWRGEADGGGVAADGWYRFLVQARDVAGNLVESSSPPVLLDTAAPAIAAVSLTPPVISPNGDGVQDDALLGIRGGGAAWYSVRVLGLSGEPVRTLLDESQQGDVVVRWDGRDSAGTLVPDGAYTVDLRASDSAGNVAQEQRGVTVDTVPPAAVFGPWGPETLPPGQATISYTLSEPATVDAWVVDATGTTVRVLAGAAGQDGLVTLTWDATTGGGEAAPAGTYHLRLRARDGGGNTVTATDPIGVTVKPGEPPAGECADARRIVCGIASIGPGPLTMEVPKGMAWVAQLTGFGQAVFTDGALRVVDATGSGAGWNVTVALAQLKKPNGVVLPAGGLRVNGSAVSPTAATAPGVACDAESTCTLPVVQGVTYPVTVPAGNPHQPVRIYSAAAESGLGTVTLSPFFWLQLPASVEAGVYEGILTFALNAGP